jgi:hypothetical protein
MLVFAAREARPVWIASRASDVVAPDAELLADSAMAAGTRHRIDTSLRAVLSTARREPSSRVRASRGGPRRDTHSRVTVQTRALRVAGRTEPRVGARFLRMTRCEAGPMQPREAYFVERQLGGKRGHRALAVARRALPFRVAARAKVAFARCPGSVFAYPIAVVHQMVLRHRAVIPKVDVAPIAVG